MITRQCRVGKRAGWVSRAGGLGLFLAVTVGGPSACTAQATGDWIYSRANPEMTGICATSLRLPLELAWSFKSMEKPKGKPEMMVASAVVRAGKVYAGNKDGTFFCLDLLTGKEVWQAKAPKGGFDGAAGFAGALVIAGSIDGFVYAWNADTGKEVWRFETDGEIHAAVNVWSDPAAKAERVLIGSYDYKLYCLNAADGKKVWEAETSNYINGGSAVAEGKVCVGGCDALLHVYDAATGKVLKEIDAGAYIGNNVAMDRGVVYVTHYGFRVEAYAMADGAKVWQYGERDFEYYAAPAIMENKIIAAGRDKRLHGIDRVTGKGLWEFKTRDRIDSSPVVCGGTSAIFGSDDGYVYSVDVSNGQEQWKYEIGAAVKTSAAVAGDFIIFGADDGVIYAFKNAPVK